MAAGKAMLGEVDHGATARAGLRARRRGVALGSGGSRRGAWQPSEGGQRIEDLRGKNVGIRGRRGRAPRAWQPEDEEMVDREKRAGTQVVLRTSRTSSRRRGKLAGYLDDDAGGSGSGFLLTKLKLQAAILERRRHAGRTRLCAGTTK
jgi:hypothetical protein